MTQIRRLKYGCKQFQFRIRHYHDAIDAMFIIYSNNKLRIQWIRLEMERVTYLPHERLKIKDPDP